MLRRTLALSGAAAVLAWGTRAAGSAPPPFFAPAEEAAGRGARVRMAPIHRQERRYLQVAARRLALLAEASRLATARASATPVRELAGLATTRHREAWPQLVRLLHARQMAPPLLPNEHRKLLRRMEQAQGARLDRLYLDEVMLPTLQTELAEAEQFANAPEIDRAIADWAASQLPLLRLEWAKARAMRLPGAPRARQGAV